MPISVHRPLEVQSFLELRDHYDAFLFDMWGTIYDRAVGLYPLAAHILSELKSAGKLVLLTSNAGRPATTEVFSQLGESLSSNHFDETITAGEILRHMIADQKFQQRGQKYMTLGHQRNFGLLNGLGFVEITELDQADFLIFSGLAFGDNAAFPADAAFVKTLDTLEAALNVRRPIYLTKTDMVTFFPDGSQWLGPGPLAAWYEQHGGPVIAVGKPALRYYDFIEKRFALRGKRVLAVGDQLSTDIVGAAKWGWATFHITGGTNQQEQTARVARQVADFLNMDTAMFTSNVVPDYVSESLQ